MRTPFALKILEGRRKKFYYWTGGYSLGYISLDPR